MAYQPQAIPDPTYPAEPTPPSGRSPSAPHSPLPTPHSPPPRTHLSEELVNLLVSTFRDPSLSLDEIAAHLKVPLSTLALWLTSPQVTEQINHLNSIAVWRTRTIATAALPTAAKALARIASEFMDELPSSNEPRASASGPARSPSQLPTSDFPLPTSPHLRFLAVNQRHRESARRASALLSRLSRTPQIPDPNAPSAPTRARPAASTDQTAPTSSAPAPAPQTQPPAPAATSPPQNPAPDTQSQALQTSPNHTTPPTTTTPSPPHHPPPPNPQSEIPNPQSPQALDLHELLTSARDELRQESPATVSLLTHPP